MGDLARSPAREESPTAANYPFTQPTVSIGQSAPQTGRRWVGKGETSVLRTVDGEVEPNIGSEWIEWESERSGGSHAQSGQAQTGPLPHHWVATPGQSRQGKGNQGSWSTSWPSPSQSTGTITNRKSFRLFTFHLYFGRQTRLRAIGWIDKGE